MASIQTSANLDLSAVTEETDISIVLLSSLQGNAETESAALDEALTASADVFLKVDNLFDEQQIVSRLPDGARPNMPRTASLGISVNF